MESRIRKVGVDMYQSQLEADLKRYCGKALELGADRAKLVACEEIPVDERVVLKCQIPRCLGYGTGAHCPPNTLKPAELRELLKKYQWAVYLTKDVPPEVIVRNKATKQERVSVYQNIFKIVNELESMAFYDGHYLAFGFAAGSCRHTFCGSEETCKGLQGKKCRFALRARPSMEAVGIDVYKMVALAGWDVYPIGCDAMPADIPKGNLAGIVIVQ